VSGFLFGVHQFESPGVITRIDPATGKATVAATFPTPPGSKDWAPAGTISAIAFSPGGSYSILTVDPAKALVTSTAQVEDHFAMEDVALTPDCYFYATNFSWCLVRLDGKGGHQGSEGCGHFGPLGGLAAAP
jgi:hypothetical protein